MTWWQILFIIIVLAIASYLFGFWDEVADKMNVTVGQSVSIVLMLVVLSLMGFVLTYVIFAYCHKWIGPYIFGG